MEYIENFYKEIKKAIIEARVNIVLYVPDMTNKFLLKKEGPFFNRKSILDLLKKFIFRNDTLLEYTYSDKEFFPIEAFQPLEYQVVFNTLTDKRFVMPLAGFAEAFAIMDGKDVFFMPYAQKGIPVGFKQTDSLPAARFFQQIYTQITKHEREFKIGQATDDFVLIAPTKEAEKTVKSVTDEMRKYARSSHNHLFNPFITQIINKHIKE